MHYFDASKPRSVLSGPPQHYQHTSRLFSDANVGLPLFAQTKSTRYDAPKETAPFMGMRTSKFGDNSSYGGSYHYGQQSAGYDQHGQGALKQSYPAANYLYKDLTDTQQLSSNSRTNFNEDTSKKTFFSRTTTLASTESQFFNENAYGDYVSKSTAYSPKRQTGSRALKNLAYSIAKAQPLSEVGTENKTQFFKINRDKRAKLDEIEVILPSLPT